MGTYSIYFVPLLVSEALQVSTPLWGWVAIVFVSYFVMVTLLVHLSHFDGAKAIYIGVLAEIGALIFAMLRMGS